ncbi:hypothetical protein EA462_12510 [Natrarchaeobius halalkaliphilus]|uniref:Uncharacterized protein n=1 Tax=Natrarchaeobius halalkaliphilus TaxID=1679091 RepID=A0A3N6MUV0_9EURY|nr:hypothetical protein [Natrarchaeobius halalkaliphilus]RQG89182.1 hypothetical protein EA462_12510 [Natrarchaeobius halalkaliphilus]
MTRKTLLAAILAAAMILSAFAPLGVAAANSDEPTDELSLVVSGDGVVTVTANESPIENVTVGVSTDDNESYAGTGEYSTDVNGTVELPESNESVTVTITASTSTDTVEATATLEPADENDEIDDGDDAPFGSLVSAYVDEQRNESSGPLGVLVANFVLENNPGNASDHAGPPDHAGGQSSDDEHDQGPPDHAGGPSDDDEHDRGPPDHAGGPSDDDDGGPPGQAGPP